jgi:DNA-binding response OmpR family regulator
MLRNILVVEDEPSLAKILKFDLERSGFKVTLASNGDEAYLATKDKSYDCLIIDWMLPGMNGLDLVKKLREEKYQALLVMLTARTSEFHAIEGLSNGADLYLKKPISNYELIAQINALLGYVSKDQIKINSEIITFGDIFIDLKQYKVTINEKEQPLTKMEFDLLKFFIMNKEQALSRDTILNAIWGFAYDGATRIVDVHIYNLKKKLEGSTTKFKPVRGIGYALFLK